MEDLMFWLVMLALCVFLWWAAFYSTKDMRIKKNKMIQEMAQKERQAAAQKKSEAAHGEDS
jgi:Na+/melibiose symporter-like transporter